MICCYSYIINLSVKTESVIPTAASCYKEGTHYKRRDDLEIRGIKGIWIEVADRHIYILFGLFLDYRPPNSDINYYLDIENSLHVAVDTDISDLIITGDLNLNI